VSFPPTTAEQRRHLYQDLEELITVGFLTHRVSVGDTHFCFRTLMPGDIHLLKYRSGPSAPWHLWAMAHSMWMLNGLNLLAEPHMVPRVYLALQRLPDAVQNMLFSVILGLFKRESKAHELLEAFCYENHSRFVWRMHGRQVPMGQIGIPGLERLGRTTLQGTWVAFNQGEDDKAQHDASWESAKLVASAISPKGLQKIDQKDKQRRAGESERRQRVMDRVFYKSKGFLVDDHIPGVEGALTAYNAQTADELSAEMQRWVEGEDDAHDRVVNEYKQRILDRMAEQKRLHQERMEALREQEAEREEADLGPMPLVGYTPAQLAQILRDRGHGMPGTRRIYPDHDPRQRLHDKYLAKEAEAPQPMVVDANGGLSPLAAQVAQRQVPFQTKRGE
jgi:hypothetical protein